MRLSRDKDPFIQSLPDPADGGDEVLRLLPHFKKKGTDLFFPSPFATFLRMWFLFLAIIGG
jgi:hypothetical protein